MYSMFSEISVTSSYEMISVQYNNEVQNTTKCVELCSCHKNLFNVTIATAVPPFDMLRLTHADMEMALRSFHWEVRKWYAQISRLCWFGFFLSDYSTFNQGGVQML